MLSVCKTSSEKCCRNRLSTQDTWSGPVQAQRWAFWGCEAAEKMFLSTVTQTCHNTSVLQAAGPERRRNDSPFFAPNRRLIDCGKNQPGGNCCKLLPMLLLKKSEDLLGMCDDVAWEESIQFANKSLSSSCKSVESDLEGGEMNRTFVITFPVCHFRTRLSAFSNFFHRLGK